LFRKIILKNRLGWLKKRVLTADEDQKAKTLEETGTQAYRL
jgi:hypothetical protein